MAPVNDCACKSAKPANAANAAVRKMSRTRRDIGNLQGEYGADEARRSAIFSARIVPIPSYGTKRVVLGGPYVTTTIEDLPDADHIFIGEAETTLPEFIRDLERGQTKRTYEAKERPALSATPLADFLLADFKRYSAMSVQYSRGCPFSCEFCDIIEIYGRVPRTKSNQQMIAEFDALRALGWRGTVFIVDDNFIGNKKNVRLLLPELAEWNKWDCSCS